MIKLRRMRWMGHVAQMGEKMNGRRLWWGSQRKRDHWEDKNINEYLLLSWKLES
jgi:hypothetical protein